MDLFFFCKQQYYSRIDHASVPKSSNPSTVESHGDKFFRLSCTRSSENKICLLQGETYSPFFTFCENVLDTVVTAPSLACARWDQCGGSRRARTHSGLLCSSENAGRWDIRSIVYCLEMGLIFMCLSRYIY